MLDTQEVKKILNDPTLSDKEVTEIRDSFAILADIIFDEWIETVQKERGQKKSNTKSLRT